MVQAFHWSAGKGLLAELWVGVPPGLNGALLPNQNVQQKKKKQKKKNLTIPIHCAFSVAPGGEGAGRWGEVQSQSWSGARRGPNHVWKNRNCKQKPKSANSAKKNSLIQNSAQLRPSSRRIKMQHLFHLKFIIGRNPRLEKRAAGLLHPPPHGGSSQPTKGGTPWGGTPSLSAATPKACIRSNGAARLGCAATLPAGGWPNMGPRGAGAARGRGRRRGSGGAWASGGQAGAAGPLQATSAAGQGRPVGGCPCPSPTTAHGGFAPVRGFRSSPPPTGVLEC